jgi:hypothetical protein
MLVERSVKTGRIAKNEEYTIDEFLDKTVPVVHIYTPWHKRLFGRKTMEKDLNNHMRNTFKRAINLLIDFDEFGRKRK